MRIQSLQRLERRIKFLFRTGSPSFALHYASKPSRERSFRFNGRPLFYRTGSSDVEVLASILLVPPHRSEYALEVASPVKTILDIGGNIGATAIYLARAFPAARIFSFEPVPDNFALLSKNVAGYPNITPVNIALSDKNGLMPIYRGERDNNGGFSLHGELEKQTGEVICEVSVRNFPEWLAENKVTAIDLIKIDAEGAEYEILTAMPPPLLAGVSAIIGEIHGYKDEELLAYLGQWFELSIKRKDQFGFFRGRRRV